MSEMKVDASTTYLTPELVENLTARLNRLEGHVRGVNNMLQEQKPCDEILIQLSAIKGALNQITIKLLEGHIELCLTDFIQAGETDSVESLMNALGLVLKNS